MCIPVVNLLGVAFSKLYEAAEQLCIGEVFVVLQVEQDLVATHLFEIDVVFDRSRLLS